MSEEERDAEIRRLFYGEHWTMGTIATQLGVHRDVVERVVGRDGFARKTVTRPSALDPFVPFMRETLERYPGLTGSRLHRMLRERGYQGSVIQVRRRIRTEGLRKQKKEAFFELRMPPAEEAQVDWMHVGTLDVPGGRRTVSALVIVLSHSRATWVHFSFDQQIESVLRGHIEAFEFFGGVPRKLLYDNMKTVVVERRGDAIRFHSRLYGLAQHYLFSATPCGPYRPHEKGRVERRIRDLRSSFLAALSWSSLDDLRTEFRRWQQEVLFERRHPRDDTRTIREVFEEERKLLLDLPNHPPDAQLIKAVTLRKQPYVTFDTNRYSVPPEFVNCCLTLAVSANRVRVLDGDTVIASHARSFGKKQRIDDPAHLDALAANKRKAAALRGRDRVTRMLPIAQTWYGALARRNFPMAPQTAKLLRLVEQYSLEDIDQAIETAIERQTPSVESVRHLLETASTGKPRIPLDLPDHLRKTHVHQHPLSSYDDDHDPTS